MLDMADQRLEKLQRSSKGYTRKANGKPSG